MRRPCTEMLCRVSTGWRLHLLTRLGAYAALIAVFLCAFQLATAVAQNAKPPAAGAGIRDNILGLLSNEKGMPLPIKQRREALQAYYKNRKNQILWLEGNRAEAFISRLRNAERDGLDPSDYPSKQLASLIAAKSSADVRNLAATELYFSAAFIQYASALNVGRFLPNKVDPNFFLKGRSIDQLSVLVDVLKMGDVDRTLDKWQPSNPRYLALRSALARYRNLASAGGWGTIPLGPALRPGMSDSRVPAIRARLAVTDGANTKAPSSEQKVYDKALVEAVKRFQARNGGTVDGIIGSGTIVAMNVPVQDRDQQHHHGHGAFALDAGKSWTAIPDRQHRRLRTAPHQRRRRRRANGRGGRQAVSSHAGFQRPDPISSSSTHIGTCRRASLSTKNCRNCVATPPAWQRGDSNWSKAIVLSILVRSIGPAMEAAVCRLRSGRSLAPRTLSAVSNSCFPIRTTSICTTHRREACFRATCGLSAMAASGSLGLLNSRTRFFVSAAFRAGTSAGSTALSHPTRGPL